MLGGTGPIVNFTRCQSLVSAWSPGHPRTRVRRRVYSRLLRNLSDAWRVISLRPSLVTGEPLPSARVSEHRQLGSKPALGGGNQSIRNYRPRTRSAHKQYISRNRSPVAHVSRLTGGGAHGRFPFEMTEQCIGGLTWWVWAGIAAWFKQQSFEALQ
jgi:hypothetical protein